MIGLRVINKKYWKIVFLTYETYMYTKYGHYNEVYGFLCVIPPVRSTGSGFLALQPSQSLELSPQCPLLLLPLLFLLLLHVLVDIDGVLPVG